MIHLFELEGELKFAVIGVFGNLETEIDQLQHLITNTIDQTHDDCERTTELSDAIKNGGQQLCEFFGTEGEARAYIKGLNDMNGWIDFNFTDVITQEYLYDDLDENTYKLIKIIS